MITNSIEGLSESLEIYEVSDEFLQRLADAVNVRVPNRPRKPKRIRQPLRYPRRCRPRPRETPGVNPLNRLKTVREER
jgi:hypothetical protein